MRALIGNQESAVKLLLACAGLFFLAGCGVGPGITGNDSGGIIPYPLAASQHGTSDLVVAKAMASEFCARYNKQALITSIHREYGDYVGFDCRWSLSRPGS